MLDLDKIPAVLTDSHNPLAWVLVLALLLGNTDEVINAITGLIRVIASRKDNKGNDSESKKGDHDKE
jgi:hypothetical protein